MAKTNKTLTEAVTTLKFGIVTEIKNGAIKAKLQDCDDLITDWLPVVIFGDTQDNKSFAMPAVGAQVALILDSRCEDGVCLGSIYSDVDSPTAPNDKTTHTKYSDGAVIEYNPETSTLNALDVKDIVITAKGDVNITVTGNTTIKSSGDLSLESGGAFSIKSGGAFSVNASNTVNIESSTTSTIKGTSGITLDAPTTAITGGLTGGSGGGGGEAIFKMPVRFEKPADFKSDVTMEIPPVMPDAVINETNYLDHVHKDSVGGDTDPPK